VHRIDFRGQMGLSQNRCGSKTSIFISFFNLQYSPKKGRRSGHASQGGGGGGVLPLPMPYATCMNWLHIPVVYVAHFSLMMIEIKPSFVGMRRERPFLRLWNGNIEKQMDVVSPPFVKRVEETSRSPCIASKQYPVNEPIVRPSDPDHQSYLQGISSETLYCKHQVRTCA
jgi:hypothetical protein